MTDKIISQEERNDAVVQLERDARKRQQLFRELAPVFPNDEDGEERRKFLYDVGVIDNGLLQPSSMGNSQYPEFWDVVTNALENAGFLYLVEEVCVPRDTVVPANLPALLQKYENLTELTVPSYADLDSIRITLKSMATKAKRQISLGQITKYLTIDREVIQGDNS